MSLCISSIVCYVKWFAKRCIQTTVSSKGDKVDAAGCRCAEATRGRGASLSLSLSLSLSIFLSLSLSLSLCTGVPRRRARAGSYAHGAVWSGGRDAPGHAANVLGAQRTVSPQAMTCLCSVFSIRRPPKGDPNRGIEQNHLQNHLQVTCRSLFKALNVTFFSDPPFQIPLWGTCFFICLMYCCPRMHRTLDVLLPRTKHLPRLRLGEMLNLNGRNS